MTAVAFCRERGLPLAGFYAWRRRLNDPSRTDLAMSAMTEPTGSAASGFVRLEARLHGAANAEVRFDCGATLHCSWDRIDVVIEALVRESRT